MVTTARVLGVVFLSLLGTSQGLPILSEVSKVLEDVTVPAAVLIPAIKLGPDVAKRWLSSILTKAKNAATLETFSTKPFNVVVPSDSWTNADFHANFSAGTASGLNHLTRLDDCEITDNVTLIQCRLPLKDVHIKAKAEVKGDVFIPTVHPLVATSTFSGSAIIFHLEHVLDNVGSTVAAPVLALRNATLSDKPKVHTIFVGTLSLNEKRHQVFKKKLADTLTRILENDILSKYIQTLNSLLENAAFSAVPYLENVGTIE